MIDAPLSEPARCDWCDELLDYDICQRCDAEPLDTADLNDGEDWGWEP